MELIIVESNIRDHALSIRKEKGLMYINGFDHPNILAGQGTCGLEILEQVQEFMCLQKSCNISVLIQGS